MSAGLFFQLLGAGGGVNPLAVQYEDLAYVTYEDSDNVLYEG